MIDFKLQKAFLAGSLIILLIFLGVYAHAMEFEFGTLGLDYYDSFWGAINVVNTTGSAGSLLPGVDITDGELWYSLASDQSGTNSTNYHLILADENKNSDLDWFFNYDVTLTYQYYASYDSNTNTYTDGEDVSAIGPSESLINLVDLWYTHTLIDTSLYIKDLKFTGKAHLDNFTFEDNGVTYTYTGDVDLAAELFTNDWYSVGGNAGVGGSSVSILGDIPENQPAPVPEPSTILFVAMGVFGIFGLRRSRCLK